MTATPLAVFALTDRQDWMDQHAESAVCAETDPDLWFPEHGAWTQSRLAKRLCGSCPFLHACREWALEHPSAARHGIWGGMSEQERREELRRRGYVEPAESEHEEVAA